MSEYPKRLMPVGDVHARPGDNLDHMTWAGKLAAHHRVDMVVFMGDIGDFASCNASVKPLEREGNRIAEDERARNLAIDTFFAEYEQEFYILDGNHENYLIEAVNQDPKLEGLIDVQGLGEKFLKPIDVYGFSCRHYVPVEGNHKRAQNPETYKFKRSCIVGHSHHAVLRRDYDESHRPIYFVDAGCWVSEDFASLNQKHDYTYGSRRRWDIGLWLLDVVAPGVIGHYSWWPYEKVKKAYG